MDFSAAPDLISNLPDDIVEEIMQRVPLKDCVKTSVLSSKWKDKWKTVPRIVFDKNNLICTQETILTNKFASIVDKVFRGHRGEIHKFKLAVSYLKTKASSFHISKWITVLAKKNIRDMTLDIHKGTISLEDGSLFACKSLRVLKLRNCTVKPHDSSDVMNSLKEFWFEGCIIPTCDLKKLLKCPVLEKLALVNVRVDPIEVPSLKYLHIQGWFIDIRIKNAEGITDFLIHQSMPIARSYRNDYREACQLSTVLACVRNVQKLDVWAHSMEFLFLGNVLLKLPFMLNNLKEVFLAINFGNMDDLSTGLCLLRSSPNLERLRIGVWFKRAAHSRKANELWRNHLECYYVFKHLKDVTLERSVGSKSEGEYIMYFLEHSPQLQKLTIKVLGILYDAAVEWLQALPPWKRSIVQVLRATEEVHFQTGFAREGGA